ncbi:hypothetical protein F4808DRAFT_286738 [Astrocystis sublimbata]|nr:hypothetical protein F4808DRAFT_286738 [Astrocystis sublimbata]
MHSTKVLVTLGSLAAGSLAQSQSESFTTDPSCLSSIKALYANGPALPDSLTTILPQPDDLLAHPADYASTLCAIAQTLPPQLLSDFGDYGVSVLAFASREISSYEAIVTKCFTTGPEASAATSYFESLASATGAICPITGSSSGTASITPAPTSMPTVSSTAAPGNGSTATSSIPVAAAARHEGLIAGALAAAGALVISALL